MQLSIDLIYDFDDDTDEIRKIAFDQLDKKCAYLDLTGIDEKLIQIAIEKKRIHFSHHDGQKKIYHVYDYNNFF